MTAMTKTERNECATNQQRHRERLDTLANERAKAAADVKALEDDMAAGIDGARTAALNRADDVRALDMEINAVERLLAAEEAREEADKPFLSADLAAARKAKAQEAALGIVRVSRLADEAVVALVAALEERAAMAAEFSQFLDLTGQSTIQQVPTLLGGALAKAGIRKFDSNYQLSQNGPNGFSEDDARVLAAVLPADDPSVLANKRRQEAINIEHRRLQGQHTEIVGPKVTVVSPGRP